MKRNLNRSWDFSDSLLEDYADEVNNITIDVEAEKKEFESSVRSSEWFNKLDIDRAEFDIYNYEGDPEIYGVLRLYKTFNGEEARDYIYTSRNGGKRYYDILEVDDYDHYVNIEDADCIRWNWLEDNVAPAVGNTTDGKYDYWDMDEDSYENNLKVKNVRYRRTTYDDPGYAEFTLAGTFSVECTIEFFKNNDIEECLTEGSVNSIQSPWDDVDVDTLPTYYSISCGDDHEEKRGILAKDALRNILAFIRKHQDRIPEISLDWLEGTDGKGDVLVSIYSKNEPGWRQWANRRSTLTNWPEAERMIRNALHLHNKKSGNNNSKYIYN